MLSLIADNKETNMEKTRMEVRCYRKSELAAIYFPDMDRDSAVQKLMRWVKRCTDLLAELTGNGYNPKNRTFSAREVRLIFSYLGEP